MPLEQVAVDGPDATDHAVSRSSFDQFADGASATLRGDDHRPVLDERAFVDQVGDVLAGGAPANRPPLRNRLRPGRVEPDGMAFVHLGQIRSNGRRLRSRILHGRGSDGHTGCDGGHDVAGHHR